MRILSFDVKQFISLLCWQSFEFLELYHGHLKLCRSQYNSQRIHRCCWWFRNCRPFWWMLKIEKTMRWRNGLAKPRFRMLPLTVTTIWLPWPFADRERSWCSPPYVLPSLSFRHFIGSHLFCVWRRSYPVTGIELFLVWKQVALWDISNNLCGSETSISLIRLVNCCYCCLDIVLYLFVVRWKPSMCCTRHFFFKNFIVPKCAKKTWVSRIT